MKLLLDTCVLYPTVMREMLLGAADALGWQPLWSARILEEWVHAAGKLGPEGPVLARGEVALLRAKWPNAEAIWPPSLEARLWLPDPADCHVLAAAIAGSADQIVTLNAKDFPRNILREEGVERCDPDTLLLQAFMADQAAIAAIAGSLKNALKLYRAKSFRCGRFTKRPVCPNWQRPWPLRKLSSGSFSPQLSAKMPPSARVFWQRKNLCSYMRKWQSAPGALPV